MLVIFGVVGGVVPFTAPISSNKVCLKEGKVRHNTTIITIPTIKTPAKIAKAIAFLFTITLQRYIKFRVFFPYLNLSRNLG